MLLISKRLQFLFQYLIALLDGCKIDSMNTLKPYVFYTSRHELQFSVSQFQFQIKIMRFVIDTVLLRISIVFDIKIVFASLEHEHNDPFVGSTFLFWFFSSHLGPLANVLTCLHLHVCLIASINIKSEVQ